MEERYCQSCGMPMGDGDELYGTEKDGGRSADYCMNCYSNGEFTSDLTMAEMLNLSINDVGANNSGLAENGAYNMMKELFPQLKRWRKD